ncbi:MAG: class I SAM-dependent methyltransferase [Actinomycetota bacterium]|nr:class I SAM-dependent methyltransferase [Actinomycetota bacterium]
MTTGGDPGADRVTVPERFDTVASHYDLLVHLNPGYHRHLRLSARRLSLECSTHRLRLLDVGCGTGASTAALLHVYPDAEVVGIDASAGMIAAARAKPWPAGVRFVHARAEDLTTALERAAVRPGFDGALAAYLVRNVTHREGLLGALRDALMPGGRLAVHEYSVADSRWARLRWRIVCRGVIMPLAWAVSGDTSLYRYLERSVLGFDGVRAFERQMRGVGFTDVHTLPVGGWQRGIAHTFLATVPTSGPARTSPDDTPRGPRP